MSPSLHSNFPLKTSLQVPFLTKTKSKKQADRISEIMMSSCRFDLIWCLGAIHSSYSAFKGFQIYIKKDWAGLPFPEGSDAPVLVSFIKKQNPKSSKNLKKTKPKLTVNIWFFATGNISELWIFTVKREGGGGAHNIKWVARLLLRDSNKEVKS